MKTFFLALTFFTSLAWAQTAVLNQPAPAFSLTGSDGMTYTLEQFKGKTVVLEWFNDSCPYVKKHYGAKNMQTLQKNALADGTVWLTIVSSAKGKQGHLDQAGAAQMRLDQGMNNTAFLLDGKGEAGRAYGAKTTPHMYVIDGKGVLVYAGAIDDRPSADPATLKGAKNYVTQALNELKKNKSVTVGSMKPYGCSIKYE